jgi:hypothetical protein
MCSSATCKPTVFHDMFYCTERHLMWQIIDLEPPTCNKDAVNVDDIVILGED